MPTNVSQMAGRSRTSTGQNATMLLLRGGVAVDRWERLRGGAFGFGLYKERSSFGPTPWTSDPRADQHVEQVWFAGVHSDVGGGYPDPALAEIALLWMADRARERDSSSKRMPSQRRLRMPPRRHKTGWPYVDPNPLGTLRQSRTAWGLQLTPGPVMAGGRYGGRPGSDPAGNPPLSRCIRSPIRCSVWMRRKLAASSGEHPERRERLRNTKSLATRPGQQARTRAV